MFFSFVFQFLGHLAIHLDLLLSVEIKDLDVLDRPFRGVAEELEVVKGVIVIEVLNERQKIKIWNTKVHRKNRQTGMSITKN